MKNIKFSTKESIFLIISFVILLLYLIMSYNKVKIMNKNKTYEHLICLQEICIDNGIYDKCMTFNTPESFAIKILNNDINNNKFLKLIKLNKKCK